MPVYYSPTTESEVTADANIVNDNVVVGDGGGKGVKDSGFSITAVRVPTGGIIMFGGALPTGYLNANGATVSQATYAALFAVYGHNFGPDPGGGNFILPDLRDRFPVGIGTTYTMGATGGEAAVTLTEGQLPSHTHGVPIYAGGISASSGTSSVQGLGDSADNALGTSPVGSGEAHNNLPPYIGVRYIIKT